MNAPSGEQAFAADHEHAGLRAAILILLLVFLVVSYQIIRVLVNWIAPAGAADYGFLMACGGALPLSLALVWLAEQALKRLWPSGRAVVVDAAGVRTRQPAGPSTAIPWSENMNVLAWAFHLKGFQRGGRERRVSRSWLCLAVQLRADDRAIVVYAYLPPTQAGAWIHHRDGRLRFHEISPRDVYERSLLSRFNPPDRPEIPAKVLAGRDGRYWLAERRRWQEGFELMPGAFEQFLHLVESHVAEAISHV